MPLVIAHVFFVIANSFHILFVASKRTDLLLGATLIAALVNIVMNLAVVPRMGIFGAALSTLVGYIVLTAGMALAGLWLIRRLIAVEPRPA
jgi:O-antigen/teichoic acid export membrane protein